MIFEIRNQANNKADLYIYGDIVSDSWGKWVDEDTCPADIAEKLNSVKGCDLNIYINSGGGSVFAGLAIYNQFKRFDGHKTVYIDGLAASIASVIALAGDEVYIPSNAFMMIHNPWVGIAGNANELRKMADDLDRLTLGILEVYKENLAENGDIEVIKTMMDKETWLTADMASEFFNVKISENLDAVACASDIVQSYKNVPKSLKMQKNDEKEADFAENMQIEQEKELLRLKLQLI